MCELCRDSQDPHNAFRRNAGHAGCGSFKVSSYKEHEAKYHPKVEQARAIHKSLEEQQALEDDRMLRVFMCVYWLASDGLPMLRIYTLAMLIRQLDFRGAINCVWNVGRKYVNHMAATEIMMSIAAVLREWINEHARTSRVLGLMIDESTDTFATWFDKSMSETLNFFCRSVKRVQELERFAVL